MNGTSLFDSEQSTFRCLHELRALGLECVPGAVTIGTSGGVCLGDNITSGYESNPQTNVSSCANGWFRTGDQNFLDVAGYYLFITACTNEVIT